MNTRFVRCAAISILVVLGALDTPKPCSAGLITYVSASAMFDGYSPMPGNPDLMHGLLFLPVNGNGQTEETIVPFLNPSNGNIKDVTFKVTFLGTAVEPNGVLSDQVSITYQLPSIIFGAGDLAFDGEGGTLPHAAFSLPIDQVISYDSTFWRENGELPSTTVGFLTRTLVPFAPTTDTFVLDYSYIPEPSSITLLGIGTFIAIGAGYCRHKRWTGKDS